MKRLCTALICCLVTLTLGVPAAEADFNIFGYDVAFTNKDLTTATQAGSHPFALTTSLGVNFGEKEGKEFAENRIKDISLAQAPGLVADVTAYKRCSSLDFLQHAACPEESQVGITAASSDVLGWVASPVYSLTTPPGVLMRLGWNVAKNANIVIDVRLDTKTPYVGVAASHNTPQTVDVIGVKNQLWGNPTDQEHDALRGSCLKQQAPAGTPLDAIEAFEFESTGESCSITANPKPLLTLPTFCGQPLPMSFEATSWEGGSDSETILTHDVAGNPRSFTGCGALPPFDPSITAQPTSKAAESPSGLDFSLHMDNAGLTSASGLAKSAMRKAVVTLPEGMTANPSLAEGLAVCSIGDLEKESLLSEPGEGCPEASKIGTVEVESPIVSQPVKGILYEAEPFANLAGDALLAQYIVLKNPDLGIFIKQALKVEADPRTGQLVATADEIPDLPISNVRIKLREGGRSPLVTPPTCGSHPFTVAISPWSGQAPMIRTATFQIVVGPDNGPCPNGAQPFEPTFEAGSTNNAAGQHTSFSIRLTRRDGDQDLTRFDAVLPPGVGGILAGIAKCPDAQIAQAKTKSGRTELQSPSCPASSKVGTIESGAGVGSQLTYVPGTLYLAGPFGGAPLSVVGIVPAVAGPFDVGTVVVRQALRVDPLSGQITVDGAHSDPIPHILAGIPLRVRDIQVHVNRANFIYNPTSCEPFQTVASIWGGGSDPFSTRDDSPVAREARFQASSCASLGFKPGLTLKLRGGTRRGAFPKLHIAYVPRKHDAHVRSVALRLPHSEFVEQGHIRTICTRVQYAAHQCPAASIYGHARAFTPIFDEPLEGPVYLRSSNHSLPDAVLSLHGVVDVEAVARIDSVHGELRATVEDAPDAPITKVLINMQGKQKGLLVNSTNLCRNKHRARALLEAHNGKRRSIRPVLGAVGCRRNGAVTRSHR